MLRSCVLDPLIVVVIFRWAPSSFSTLNWFKRHQELAKCIGWLLCCRLVPFSCSGGPLAAGTHHILSLSEALIQRDGAVLLLHNRNLPAPSELIFTLGTDIEEAQCDQGC